MESKITSTSSATDDSTSNNSKNLIVRFVEYSFQILNHDMDEFFEDNMMVFDQDQHDLEDGRGETLEQYDVYQKYLKLLEVYFDEFAMKEGYQTSKECFDDINQLIVDDEIERKKLFKEMTERMMEAFHQLQQQINDANENIEEGDEKDNPRSEIRHGSKVHDEDEDEKHDMKLMKQSDSKSSTRVNHDKKDSKNSHHDEIADAKTSNDDEQHQGQHQAPAPPVIMFFQPVSLDSMLQHVLSLTEYTTFSYIIRTKLKQKQLYLSLLDRVEKQSKNTTKRLKNIERKEHLEEIYQELIQRICDFAPNQPQFQTQIRSHLSVKSWNELLSAGENGDSITPEEKLLFKRITMNVSMAVWNFVAVGEQAIVRQALSVFMPQIDQLESNADIKIAAGNFLSMAHGLVDKTEQKMLASLQEYYDKHHVRKNQAKGTAGSHHHHEEKESHHHGRAESK